MQQDVEKFQYFFIGNLVGLSALIGCIVLTAPQKQQQQQVVDSLKQQQLNSAKTQPAVDSTKVKQISNSKPQKIPTSKSQPIPKSKPQQLPQSKAQQIPTSAPQADIEAPKNLLHSGSIKQQSKSSVTDSAVEKNSTIDSPSVKQ